MHNISAVFAIFAVWFEHRGGCVAMFAVDGKRKENVQLGLLPQDIERIIDKLDDIDNFNDVTFSYFRNIVAGAAMFTLKEG